MWQEKKTIWTYPENGTVSDNMQWWSYPPQRPRYCKACGKLLSTVDNRKPQFNEYTGEREYIGSVVLRCPDWGFAARAENGMLHTDIVWTEQPRMRVTLSNG